MPQTLKRCNPSSLKFVQVIMSGVSELACKIYPDQLRGFVSVYA